MGKETEMYELHCKDQFKDLKNGNTELKGMVTKLSDRLLKSNGQRSVVACVEDNARALDRHIKGDAPVKTVKRLKIGKLVDCEGYNGSDVIKILLLVTLILYVVGQDYGPKLLGLVIGDKVAEVVSVE